MIIQIYQEELAHIKNLEAQLLENLPLGTFTVKTTCYTVKHLTIACLDTMTPTPDVEVDTENQMVDRVLPSALVEIEIEDPENGLVHTGFGYFFAQDWFVTNQHLVPNSNCTLRVSLEGYKSELKFEKDYLWYCQDDDFVILQIKDFPREYEPVMDAWTELPDENGICTIYGETIVDGQYTSTSPFLRIECKEKVSFGSSGGLVFDDRNRVLGLIVASTCDDESVVLARPLLNLTNKGRHYITHVDDLKNGRPSLYATESHEVATEASSMDFSRFDIGEEQFYYIHSAENLKFAEIIKETWQTDEAHSFHHIRPFAELQSTWSEIGNSEDV
eukprot:TRINITY_DN13694_c0_g1_i2.p1 TRINITY_DN13694_c0_g1~~TRINITY_DN13694_c0_g1_i2.p1  ORF type:complete len:331 (+),score=20.58 TRINITY_DN13694_c0_g1_i2:216-1208(+)